MGEGAVRRLITSAIRLLMNDISATSLYGLPGPQAIGNEPQAPHSRNPLDAHAYPRTSLSTFLRIPRYSSLIAPTQPRNVLLTYGTNRTSINGNPFYRRQLGWGHSEKRTSDLTGVYIFLWCKIRAVFSETTGRKEASLD